MRTKKDFKKVSDNDYHYKKYFKRNKNPPKRVVILLVLFIFYKFYFKINIITRI